jgi:hypothetical protein
MMQLLTYFPASGLNCVLSFIDSDFRQYRMIQRKVIILGGDDTGNYVEKFI